MSFSRRKFQNCWFLLISLIWHASFIIDRWLRARKVYTKVGAFHKNRSYLHSNFVVQKLIQEITHFVYFFSCFIVKRLPNIKEVVFSYYTVLNFFFFSGNNRRSMQYDERDSKSILQAFAGKTQKNYYV